MAGTQKDLLKYSGKTTSKYHNKKIEGFDSTREYIRYQELKLMERAGKIYNLNRQVKFVLLPSQYEGKKCVCRQITYIADFTYYEKGKLVVEDCKGFKTDVYRIKKKLMYAKYKILIKES